MKKSKFKKVAESNFYNFLGFIMLMVMIIFMNFTLKFMIGFHNLDNCQNYEFINYEVNKILYENKINETFELHETYLDGSTTDLKSCYLEGLQTILYTPFIMSYCAFIIGAILQLFMLRKIK